MSVSAWEQASNWTRVLYGKLTDEPAGGLIVSTKIIGANNQIASCESHSLKRTTSRLCLFKLHMLADGSLAATIRFKCLCSKMNAALGFYLGYKAIESEKLCYIHTKIVSPRPNHIQETTILLSFPAANSRLVELGVYGLNLVEDPRPMALCQILNVTIKPRSLPTSSWIINDVRVTERGNSLRSDKRLVWKWSGPKDQNQGFLPWSKTTGPFSYFAVIVGGKELGRAYCMEFPIQSEDFDVHKSKEVDVIVRGRLFGGNEIESSPLQLSGNVIEFL